jgi:purine-binding chemotaxis protein CheW
MHSGIRVDELLDVVDLPLSQLQNPPESLPESLQPYVAALVDFSGKPVALLDIEKVFADYQEGLG